MATPKIYFSQSFHTADEPVVNAVHDVFDELRERIPFEDVSTMQPTSEQLFSRLVGPMRAVDIVVCIFTKRHRVGGTKKPVYTAPPYVVSEASAALTQGKRVLVFVEKGVPREELGFIDAYNPQWQEIDRKRCGTTAYHRTLVKSVGAALKFLVRDRPPSFTYELYDAQIGVYPNGYILANQRLDVRALTGESIRHSYQLYPAGTATGPLPTASELYAIGRSDPNPFPTTPFTSFASSSQNARLVPVDKPNGGTAREYKIELGGPGPYHYEWIWGTPYAFDPARDREWYLLEISQRDVERVRIVLRLHHLLERVKKPKWAQVTAGRLADGDPGDVQLPAIESDADQFDVVRENPFFTCYELTLNQIRRGYDLLLLF